MKTHVNAARITRQSKSNLALAFISLGRERKRDITIFYAFCRVIDDIADSSELNVAQKRVRLEAWRKMVRAASADEPSLAREVRSLIDKYSLPPGMLQHIQGDAIRLAGLQVPAGLDPITKATVQRSIGDAFVFGFRIVILICAGLSLTSTAVTWLMVPKDDDHPRLELGR